VQHGDRSLGTIDNVGQPLQFNVTVMKLTRHKPEGRCQRYSRLTNWTVSVGVEVVVDLETTLHVHLGTTPHLIDP
jgi:hypothetical protein